MQRLKKLEIRSGFTFEIEEPAEEQAKDGDTRYDGGQVIIENTIRVEIEVTSGQKCQMCYDERRNSVQSVSRTSSGGGNRTKKLFAGQYNLPSRF